MFVHVEVAPGLHVQRHAAVVDDLFEHVVQKTQPRRDPAAGRPASVEVEAHGDPRLARFAPYLDPPLSAADVLGDLLPRVGDERAGLRGPRFAQQPFALPARGEQDAPRPEVAGQQYIGRAVADDVARGQVVSAAEVVAEQARAGLSRGGSVALERAVDQLVGEFDPFAAERREHLFVCGQERRFGKGVGSQPVLVRGQHQLEIEPGEGLQRRDGAGYELQLPEAVDLLVRGFGDDRAVAVDEEGFFHGLKFLTVSMSRAFSPGVPTVMRRHPAHPGMRERLRTMMPAPIRVS